MKIKIQNIFEGYTLDQTQFTDQLFAIEVVFQCNLPTAAEAAIGKVQEKQLKSKQFAGED